MKKLKPIFGFDVNYDENGNIEVNDVCNYPSEKKNCQEFFNRMELLKIDESGITFPITLKHWVITINPINKETIIEYFKIKGIKKVVEEQISELIGKTTFIKPEVKYEEKGKYPKLHIHFYQLVDEGGVLIYDEYDMIDYCQNHYENTKQFTKKRVADLEKLVNVAELQQMPFLPMEMVRFDENGNIKDFEQHLLALTGVELPF
jgi:hypothetical protein